MEDLLVEVNGIEEGKILTVAIPIRASDYEYINRLEFLKNDSEALGLKEIEFLVVDDGSEDFGSKVIKEHCANNGYAYIKLDTSCRQFSVGRCRNYAAMVSKSKFIMFQDVDLAPTLGFYQGVLDEIEIQGLYDNAAKFLMIGVIYLTQAASNDFFYIEPRKRKQFFLQKYIESDSSFIEKFSTGTSVNLYNRMYFLNKGGNDDDFEGWGFEDLEFNARCIRDIGLFPLPHNWLIDYKNFSTINTYRGWKAVYRLFGDMAFIKGLVLFHVWHPVESDSDYMLKREANKKLFNAKLRHYANDKTQPLPLDNKSKGVTLTFRDNAFVSARDIHGFLGRIIYRTEENFPDEQDFLEYLKFNNVTRVLFHNPYSNNNMLKIYEWCRSNQLPYIVAERGALPDSIFFDKRGFNFDSSSYDPKYWDKEYSIKDNNRLNEYVEKVKSGKSALEKQGKRTSGEKLRKRLGIHSSKKILFVPFQRPEDTVVKYFSNDNAFEDFVEVVKKVSINLKRDWVVVYKKHPLEDHAYDVGDAVCANGENIYDLIEASNAIALINSGCGVLGMIWNKPVFCFGDAFYDHEKLAKKIYGEDDLTEQLLAGWRPDNVKTRRFLNYLVNEFYSFGEMSTRPTLMPDGARMSATINIDYSVIRGLGDHDLYIQRGLKNKITWGSPLFDRYAAETYEPTLNTNHKSSARDNLSNVSRQSENNAELSRSARRWRKFRQRPLHFFLDSQHKPLNMLGKALMKVKRF